VTSLKKTQPYDGRKQNWFIDLSDTYVVVRCEKIITRSSDQMRVNIATDMTVKQGEPGWDGARDYGQQVT
jgi:hypothetical protein